MAEPGFATRASALARARRSRRFERFAVIPLFGFCGIDRVSEHSYNSRVGAERNENVAARPTKIESRALSEKRMPNRWVSPARRVPKNIPLPKTHPACEGGPQSHGSQSRDRQASEEERTPAACRHFRSGEHLCSASITLLYLHFPRSLPHAAQTSSRRRAACRHLSTLRAIQSAEHSTPTHSTARRASA